IARKRLLFVGRDGECGFDNSHELFREHIVELLDNPTRPFNANPFGNSRVAQTKLRTQIVLSTESAAAGNLAELPERPAADGGADADFGADGSAIGYAAFALDGEPVIRVAVVVVEEI